MNEEYEEFQGARVFVTGAASGIGRATAELLARHGACVVIADVDAAGGEEAATRIRASGGTARFALCDVTRAESVQAAAAVCVDEFGGLDLAVNSAGISGPGPAIAAADYDVELLDRMIAVNLRGVFHSVKSELAHMLARNAGAIVNIASGAGLVGVAGASGYAATKHAVVGYTKSVALDYAATGIRVNAICPGLVDTPMIATGRPPEARAAMVAAHPMGRIARASEIAQAALWLLSRNSSFVTGAAIPVDGGYTAR